MKMLRFYIRKPVQECEQVIETVGKASGMFGIQRHNLLPPMNKPTQVC